MALATTPEETNIKAIILRLSAMLLKWKRKRSEKANKAYHLTYDRLSTRVDGIERDIKNYQKVLAELKEFRLAKLAQKAIELDKKNQRKNKLKLASVKKL